MQKIATKNACRNDPTPAGLRVRVRDFIGTTISIVAAESYLRIKLTASTIANMASVEMILLCVIRNRPKEVQKVYILLKMLLNDHLQLIAKAGEQ